MPNRASCSDGLDLSNEVGRTSISEWEGLVRSWLTYMRAEDRSPATIRTYEFAVTKRFLPWLVDMGLTGDLGNLTVEHFRHWLTWMKDDGLSGASRLIFRTAIRGFFKFLKEEGEIAVDPFESGRIPNPKPDEHVVEVLDAEDIAKLLRMAAREKPLGIRDAAIISVLYDAGLRAAELCGLTVEDVDLNGSLFIRHAKGGRPRMVSLGKQALRAIDKYMRWRRDYVRSLRWVDEDDTAGALFITRKGTPMTPGNLYALIKSAARRAGIEKDVHPHSFRHSAATSLADSGMGEGDMRELFGWSKGSPMVYRYTQTSAAERARRAHKRWSPLDQAARK